MSKIFLKTLQRKKSRKGKFLVRIEVLYLASSICLLNLGASSFHSSCHSYHYEIKSWDSGRVTVQCLSKRLIRHLPRDSSEMTFLENRIGQNSTQNTQSMRAQPAGWGFGISVFRVCISLKKRQLQNPWASSGAVSSLPCLWLRSQWLLLAWVRSMVSAEKVVSKSCFPGKYSAMCPYQRVQSLLVALYHP